MIPALRVIETYLAAPLMRAVPADERYTTPSTRAFCLEKLGRGMTYDLDVAACRESHLASQWYGLDHPKPEHRNGLEAPWSGHSFGNVPFSQWGHWLATAWLNFCATPAFRTHSMILPNDRTEQEPWHDLVEPFRDGRGPISLHYMKQRTKYSAPGLRGAIIKNADKTGGSPFFSSCLLIFRRRGS